MQGIIGKKIYQSSGFLEDGTRVPLTAVATKGNIVTQVKTIEKEGYNALQLGFDNRKKSSKSQREHAKKAGIDKTPRFLREIRVDEIGEGSLGKEILAKEVLEAGDIVDVSGISKGKGFAGGVKRHHFKGGPRTHGQSDRERAPGSIGQTTTPGRVYKGKRMAGRMGHVNVTVKNLEIIEITDDGLILIKGLIPGHINSIVKIEKRGVNKKFVPLYKEIIEEEKKEEQFVEDNKEAVQKEEEAIKEEVQEEVKTHEKTDDAKESVESEKESTSVKAEAEITEEQKEEVSADAKAMADKQEDAS